MFYQDIPSCIQKLNYKNTLYKQFTNYISDIVFEVVAVDGLIIVWFVGDADGSVVEGNANWGDDNDYDNDDSSSSLSPPIFYYFS